MKAFMDALSFLTLVRFKGAEFDAGRAMNAFAYAGLFIGCVLATVYILFENSFLKSYAVLAVWIVITGALHLDGLMDSADALFSHKDRENKLEIMKDPRVGAMGAVAVVMLVLLKYILISHLINVVYLILIPAIARFSMVISMKTMPYLRENGTAKTFFERKSDGWVMQVIPLVIIALYVGFKEALVMLAVAAIAYLTLKKWFTDSVGGVTGDLLGAQCEIAEVLLLTACAGFLQ